MVEPTQARFILAELTPAQHDLIARALAVVCPLCEAPAGISCDEHAAANALQLTLATGAPEGNQFHYPRIVAARRKPVA